MAASPQASRNTTGSDQWRASSAPKLPGTAEVAVVQMAAAMMPPTAPSQVLPGLTLGANLRLPSARPVKYAAMSANQMSAIIETRHQAPNSTKRVTRAAQAATTARTPKVLIRNG